MLDINLIREKTEEVRNALLKRMDKVDFSELLEWDRRKRELIFETDNLKAERNKVSASIPAMKKEGKSTDAIMNNMKKLADQIKENDTKINDLEINIRCFLERLPNIPADDVAAGGKENNKVIREWGSKPVFDFEQQNHVDLAKNLGLVDYERGVKLGGNGFWMYKGIGALMEWALLNYFIESHLKDSYEFILPPHLLLHQCGYTAGQFPKFADEVFYINSRDDGRQEHFLLPTSETALINMHRDEILSEKELPKKYFSYTPCYRKEAGSYRSDERGMIRGHQFNKVEMFQYTAPEGSENALEEMIIKAEKLMQGLGLHYRVSKLAAEDCSASMAKTYDIEVWIPSMDCYKEVSSASNAHDYQARRGSIRFRREGSKKTEYVHTLNASGLATSRLLPAIAEQLQQSDGSVIVPEALRKWVGVEKIKPIR
ncbi:MAG: serine--tRNA ligase [Bacillota bacterium]